MATTEKFVLNMGPQHPSTHGVLQVQVELDGENIVGAKPVMGYLHRGIEKLMESRTYQQCVPFTDRLDYVSSMNNNLGFCMAVEKLAGIEVPGRAQYIRTICCELNRIASHHVFIGSLTNDLGSATGMIYAFRDREKILDLFNIICGARMTCHYIRIGGVIADAQDEFLQKTEDYDIRKIDKYGIYGKLDFDIPVGKTGDNWDRYIIRLQEIVESAKIIRQCLDNMPEGPFMAKVPKMLKPPKGDAYHRVENTRGELGFYIVSDGTNKPYRVHIRRPSFINLQALDHMCKGMVLADAVTAFATIDPLMGEVDC